MTPSEGETQVAMEAAAKRQYEIDRNEATAHGIVMVPWEETTQDSRNSYLDAVMPAVWAALQALPERAPSGEDPRQKWRHLILETNDKDFTQLQYLHRLLKEDLVYGQA